MTYQYWLNRFQTIQYAMEDRGDIEASITFTRNEIIELKVIIETVFELIRLIEKEES